MATNKVSKKDLGQMLAEKYDLSKKQGIEMVDWLFEEIKDQVKRRVEVTLKDFGKFKIRESKARMGINPLTKEAISIPAKKKVKFYPAKAVKELI
ncbi:MAG: HU family DNA-binding protein [Candidatus Komeilibacteria bacterium]|nr:HU family DNA-binding protein [Candidatus Komeilibacteria bacterium]